MKGQLHLVATDGREPGTVDANGNIVTNRPGEAIAGGSVYIRADQLNEAIGYGWQKDGSIIEEKQIVKVTR